ncbi:YuzB family protein [Solibacillus sp. FSL R5-0449]|uniref:YuzB family protein n=1 Tax=Solibacillus sp. FSL R5-0449 TaxID=2921639 RepID=UPI0030D03478
MLNPLVEFCISNLANGAQQTYEQLEQDPDIDVLEYGCLSYCTKCAENFYAVVNGDIVEADTPEELTKCIYKYIEENPMW